MRKRSNDLVARIESADATFAPDHGKAWWQSFLARFLSLVLIVIAVSPLYLGGLPADAAHDVPGPAVAPEDTAPEKNPTCPQLKRSSQTWRDLSTNTSPPWGTTTVYSNSDLTVTITVDSTGKFATWTSTIGIDGVLMKAGDAGNNFYRYDDPDSTTDPGELTHDDNLTTPGAGSSNQLSHMVFCYDLDPDLTVAKSASKTTVEPGESFSYSITARNTGGATATGVTITDDLDDDLTIISATFDNDPLSGGGTGSCTVGGGNTVTCSVGDLAPNDNNTTAPEKDTAVVTIQVTAPADSCDDLVNQASVTANNEPSNLQGNNTSDQVTVNVVCANVTILKSAPVGTIDAGDTATFTILVTSTGDTTATGVTVSDTLPSGIVWTEDSLQCSISGSLLTCNFGDLAPGETRSVTITGPTGADDCGTKDNTAVVEATNEPASLQTDNSSSASITIQCGKIEILKTSDEASVSAGDDIGFTILVTNTGIGTAKDVKVTDTLPTNDGVSWTVDGGTGQSQCSINSNVLTCDFGSMAQNATKTVHISSDTTPQTCGVVSNTADAGTSNDGTASSSASVTVNCPDLEISKDGNGTINAGEVASFTIVVTNTGSGIARDVSVTDTLPAGVTWTTNSAGCAVANGNELTCNFGDLSPGATRTVTVNGTTDADDCGDLDNTAFVAATNEANTANNSDDATITVLCPDVTVLKLGNGPISAGEDAVFTILVTNTGDGVAKDVTLIDVLPPGISWTETHDPFNACTVSLVGGDVLSCDFGDLDPGETRTVTVSGVTDAQDCGELANTATVDASNEPANAPDPNQSSDSVTVLCPDMVISKVGNGTINSGDLASFTIVVTNTGDGVARDVLVTDTLPSGITWSDDSAACTVSNGNELSCDFGDLPSGATRSVTVSGVVAADDCGDLDNRAFVASSNEANTANNSDDASIRVLCAEIAISKSPDQATVNAGDQIGFTIIVANNGAGSAYDVEVSDTLPAGFSWSEDPDNLDCDINGNLLTCDFETMTAGASRTVHVVASTDADDCGVVTNTARVGTSNDGSDSSTATVTVNCADVTLQKVGNDTINAGDTAVFTILVTNEGSGDAYNVLVTDTLPSAVTWNISGGTGASDCDIDAGVLTCDFETMTAGATETVTISATTDADDCGLLDNTAEVAASNEAANDTGDNTDSDSIEVLCADVVIQKDGNGTINAGDTAIFTILVTNEGPGDAYDVSVTDTLPSGVSWNVSGGTGASDCDIDTGVLTCDFGTMTAGATETVTISGTTDAADCGTLNNTAFVASSNESNTENNSDGASIEVLCGDVVIQKDGNGTINAGDTAIFTILVTNTGDGEAKDVTVTDTLPSGITWSDDSGACTVSNGNELSCDFGDLPSGATRTVTLSGATDAADCGTLNNTAFVASSNESNTENNSDGASIEVLCGDVVIQKDGNGTINAGDTAIFTILVTNTGDGEAKDVTVTDTLPSGITWSDDSGACTVSNGNELSCDFGDLPSGATRTVTLSGATDAADCGTLNNTAFVASSNESNTENNSDGASIEVLCGDVVIQKDGNGTINAGDTAIFTILVTNEGRGDAYEVLVTDTLPSGVSWNVSGGTGASDCDIATGVLTCDFGTMIAGATETVTISGTTDAADCGTLNNTAFVASSNESNTENNSDGASIEVLCGDVVIQKDGNGTINAGDTAIFTILVTNTGDGVAKDVTVTDTLPSGITWSDDSGACTVSNGNELSCDFGDLPSGATRTVTLSGATDAADCGTLNNTAFVASSNESNTENNSDEASILVQCAAIDISKTADAASVVAGDPIGFTILVTNNGPGRADGVTVTDTLPSNGGLDWDIDGGTGAADCSISLGVLTCDFGSLENAATRTVHISSPTTAASCGTVDNTAFVATTNDGSDSDGDMVSVTCPTLGINIDKTVAPISGNPGNIVTYTYVVLNTGEATLFNISVDDDKLGHIGVIAQLDPGQSATLQKTAVLGTSGVINVATATGTDRLGRSVSDSDDASVSVVLPLTLERVPADPVIAPQTVARTLPQAIATTGVELWPPMLSAFLMILLGAACLRGSRLRPTGEYRWEFEKNS